MSTLFETHLPKLSAACEAIAGRGYQSFYPEMPSPKVYGDTAQADGVAAVESLKGAQFPLEQPGVVGWIAPEVSPYGVDLAVSYPESQAEVLVQAGLAAMPSWQRLGAKGRTGVCLEMIARLHARSFELAHSVMLTTGQGWMMAFQAGAPHALDRALEAVAYAWQAQSAVPGETVWEKPQGKNPPIRMQKHFEVVGRGVALVIGCATFPTWNSYPGLFAALATGNAVILKPHPRAVLPAAITVQTLRAVLAEQGLDPNLVTLCVTERNEVTQSLAVHPQVRSVDFTGGTAFGHWLMHNARQAQVYAELAGINHVLIDSTDRYQAMLANLAFTLCLYSGQMCTTTQAILVPEAGFDTDEGHKTPDMFEQDLAAAIDGLLAKPAVACAVLGAIQSEDTLKRIDAANAGVWGRVVRSSAQVQHPDFPNARVRTPAVLACGAADESAYLQERFGPISFVVRVADTQAGIALSERITNTHGALTAGLYSTRQDVVDAMTESTWRSKVALSVNLTESVYVNQSAAFSDFHATGGNPAANATYADLAFVANRFRVVQRRYHIAS